MTCAGSKCWGEAEPKATLHSPHHRRPEQAPLCERHLWVSVSEKQGGLVPGVEGLQESCEATAPLCFRLSAASAALYSEAAHALASSPYANVWAAGSPGWDMVTSWPAGILQVKNLSLEIMGGSAEVGAFCPVTVYNFPVSYLSSPSHSGLQGSPQGDPGAFLSPKGVKTGQGAPSGYPCLL